MRLQHDSSKERNGSALPESGLAPSENAASRNGALKTLEQKENSCCKQEAWVHRTSSAASGVRNKKHFLLQGRTPSRSESIL